jgi:hypothetical protein
MTWLGRPELKQCGSKQHDRRPTVFFCDVRESWPNSLPVKNGKLRVRFRRIAGPLGAWKLKTERF